MPTTESKRILAVLDDLFFMVKINESAKQAGLPIEFVKTETTCWSAPKRTRL